MPIPDTNFDPIFEGKLIQWGIKSGLFTITGEILSASKRPISEKFMGKANKGNINRKVWHGRHLEYNVEAVVGTTLADADLPDEGDHVTCDSYVCLCDGATINWVQEGETKVTIVLHYFPHMTLSS